MLTSPLFFRILAKMYPERCGRRELPLFQAYVSRMSNCMSGSRYPEQVASSVGRYLWFTLPGIHQTDIWNNFFDVRLVDAWYDKNLSSGKSASSLYNLLSCIQMASDYCYSQLGMKIPNGFVEHIKRLRRIQSNRRKKSNLDRLEAQNELGTPDLFPLVQFMQRPCHMDNFLRIYDTCKEVLSGNANVILSKPDYLFAMRLTLAYTVVSMALRTSAAYTFSSAHMSNADGSWSGDDPIIFRNDDHKTSSTHGHARIIVSGQGKRILCMFVGTIRQALIMTRPLTFSPAHIFLDSQGHPLTSYAVSNHLALLQRPGNIKPVYTPTYIRKCITSQIKSDGRNKMSDLLVGAVAAGLLHTTATSVKHYTVGERDLIARALHKAIVKFYSL